jgi:hypothetical protein
MKKQIGKLFISVSIIFILYSGVLFKIAYIPEKLGILFNLIFNILASPHWPSSGRVFTFFWQTVSRLVNPPSLSLDFFIPLGGIIIYVILALWFQVVVMRKIGKV